MLRLPLVYHVGFSIKGDAMVRMVMVRMVMVMMRMIVMLMVRIMVLIVVSTPGPVLTRKETKS